MRREGPLRVVIAGGGTGGHLYPGIAVARELARQRPGAEVSFAGTVHGIEARIIPREGFAIDFIRSGGIKGKAAVERLRGFALVPLGLLDAWRLVSARRPDLVVGVGGYSSGPVVLVSVLRGVPAMVLEQNAVPGLTNRLLAPVVGAAAVTFDVTRRFFGSKAFVSGNPVRPEFFESAPESGRDSDGDVRVLVVGGSQGSHAINLAMVAAAPELAGNRHIRLTHQTGERDLEMVRAAYREAGVEACVEPFLYDMGRRIQNADLIVCRSGATTLAEIAAAGKPALLVPLPSATDDHQRRNAETVARAGAAELVLQPDATGPHLASRILALAADRDRRRRMAELARSLARPDAARVIVERALALAGR